MTQMLKAVNQDFYYNYEIRCILRNGEASNENDATWDPLRRK